MITYFITLIEQTLIPLGGWGVFGALLIQEVIVFIPSALIMLGAGFLLLSGDPFSLSFISVLIFQVVLPSAAGATLGSLLVYGILYLYGKAGVERFGAYVGLSWNDIEKLNRRLTGTYADELVVFSLRAIPVVPNSAVSALCGLIRMPLGKYVLISFFGIAVRAAILAFVGFQAGELYREYAAFLDRVEGYVFLAAAVGLALTAWFMYRRRLGQASREEKSEML